MSTWVPIEDFVTSGGMNNLCTRTATPEPGMALYARDVWHIVRRAERGESQPYVYLSNFHDYHVTQRMADALTPSDVLHLFSNNVEAVHPKVTGIPIALRNTHPMIAKTLNRMNGSPRDILCYANFQVRRAPRERAWAWATSQPWVTAVAWNKGADLTAYCEALARSRFVVSPPGGGMDCYRTWEALAAGAVPIVVRSPLAPLYAGLPVLQVERFEDVTPALLESFVPDTSQVAKLTIPYWRQQLDAARGVGDLPCR